MNKRVLVALLLLMLALCMSVGSYVLLQNSIGKLGESLENALYTDLPAADSRAKIEACAARTLPKMRILALHTELEPLTQQLDRLPLLQNDPAQYRQTCLLCLRLLRDLSDAQKVTWENVL